MKFFVTVLVLSSLNAFAYPLTDKDPSKSDISANVLIDVGCGESGYFNPAACVDAVGKCYSKVNWPKTVDVRMKLTVVNQCLNKYIMRE
jgi:hypothetical protein